MSKIMLKYMLLVICFIGFIIVGFYIFGYEPTNLILNNGEHSFNKDMNLLNQTGKTDPNALVDINGIPAVVNKDGNFYGMVVIHNGLNIINVTAKAPFKSVSSNIATVNRIETPHHIDVYYQLNNTIQKPGQFLADSILHYGAIFIGQRVICLYFVTNSERNVPQAA